MLTFLFCHRHLSLSTNAIDKIQPLPGLKNLKILSLGRNNLKSISKLDDNASTLEELWASYNSIEKLDGLQYLRKLRVRLLLTFFVSHFQKPHVAHCWQVLYLGNNQLKSFDELIKLKDLPALAVHSFIGLLFFGLREKISYVS